eukprot:jgi/Mesvir1/7221/Mv19039-RA.1
MSAYDSVLGGKLKLKGKALASTSGGVKKKSKKKKGLSADDAEGKQMLEGFVPPPVQDHRTAAEKRYDEQMAAVEEKRVAKLASKTHREKVEQYNQYLAGLSEHYDIPKVGPG